MAIQERAIDRLTEHAVALYRSDRARFDAWFDEGCRTSNMARCIAGGLVLRAHDAFTGQQGEGFAEALLAAGRYDDALEVLEQALAEDQANPDALSATASALVGLGRVREAVDAVRRLGKQGRRGKVRARRDASLAIIEEVEPRLSRSPSLGDWRAYLEACVALGAKPAGQDAAARLRTSPELFDSGYGADALAVLNALIDLGAAQGAAPIIRRLRRGRPEDPHLLTAEIRCEVQKGRTAAGSLLARGVSAASIPYLRASSALATIEAGREIEGIEALARLAGEAGKYHGVTAPLARAIGARVLSTHDTRFRQVQGRPRVFNLLPFSNELTLLKLRMAEMAEWVDHFVLVEAARTFTGLEKPLRFEAAKAEFAEFLPKILHVRVPEFPDYLAGAWARDYYQRDMAVSALAGLWGPDDIVILTDADEIIRRSALDAFDGELMGLMTTNHKLFFNYTAVHAGGPLMRRSSTICRARVLREFGSSFIRFYLTWPRKGWNAIPDAGWHFSFMNTAAQLAQKIASYAHQEAVAAGWANDAKVAAAIADVRSGRFEDGWRRQELDDSFPAYVLQNSEALAEFIL
jgi:beta-1,4-mannosyl-glycoprotein beta-1,4-N-acetylglucosaminyltransferase